MEALVVVTAVATECSKDAGRWMEEQKLRLHVNSWCPRNYLAAPLVKPLLSRGGGGFSCPQLFYTLLGFCRLPTFAAFRFPYLYYKTISIFYTWVLYCRFATQKRMLVKWICMNVTCFYRIHSVTFDLWFCGLTFPDVLSFRWCCRSWDDPGASGPIDDVYSWYLLLLWRCDELLVVYGVGR